MRGRKYNGCICWIAPSSHYQLACFQFFESFWQFISEYRHRPPIIDCHVRPYCGRRENGKKIAETKARGLAGDVRRATVPRRVCPHKVVGSTTPLLLEWTDIVSLNLPTIRQQWDGAHDVRPLVKIGAQARRMGARAAGTLGDRWCADWRYCELERRYRMPKDARVCPTTTRWCWLAKNHALCKWPSTNGGAPTNPEARDREGGGCRRWSDSRVQRLEQSDADARQVKRLSAWLGGLGTLRERGWR